MADPATKRTNATPRLFSAEGATAVDYGFGEILAFGSADSVIVLGRMAARRRARPCHAWLVCAIHRGHGEFTHLYRVPASPVRGRREVELLGAWSGACLAKASEKASALLLAPGPVREPADPPSAVDKAA